jgi:asparagine N-glycosylation enzyme membrane subunit Stt3
MNTEIVRKTVTTALVAGAILALAPAAHAAATRADKNDRPSWLLGALSIAVAIAVRRKTVNTDV